MLDRELLREELPRFKHLWYWLSFGAGAINAISFVAMESFVSHVTGIGTMLGVKVIQENWAFPLEIMLIPILFILGVMISAFFVERPKMMGNKPQHRPVQVMITMILFALALGGNWHIFGSFARGDGSFIQDFDLLILICVVSGMLNGVISSTTGGVIRITHITGTATDVGNLLVRFLFSKSSQRRKHERRWFRMRLGKVCFFVLGAGVGAVLAMEVGYLAYLLPASVCAICFSYEPIRGALLSLRALKSSPEHYLPHESHPSGANDR